MIRAMVSKEEMAYAPLNPLGVPEVEESTLRNYTQAVAAVHCIYNLHQLKNEMEFNQKYGYPVSHKRLAQIALEDPTKKLIKQAVRKQELKAILLLQSSHFTQIEEKIKAAASEMAELDLNAVD